MTLISSMSASRPCPSARDAEVQAMAACLRLPIHLRRGVGGAVRAFGALYDHVKGAWDGVWSQKIASWVSMMAAYVLLEGVTSRCGCVRECAWHLFARCLPDV